MAALNLVTWATEPLPPPPPRPDRVKIKNITEADEGEEENLMKQLTWVARDLTIFENLPQGRPG